MRSEIESSGCIFAMRRSWCCRSLLCRRQYASQHGSATRSVVRPYPPAVRLHNRSADRKSHPQSVWLGSEEWFEHQSQIALGDASSRVFHHEFGAAGTRLVSPDLQPAVTRLLASHGFQTVHDQVQYYLV